MRAELRDSLEHLYPDSEVEDPPCESASLDAARGGTVAVHVLVKDLAEGAKVEVSARTKRGLLKEARWFRLVDVPVEVNTGPVSFVEKEGERNEFVTRRAPFRVYDAMDPVVPPIRADSPTVALRLEVPIAAEARPGGRDWTLHVEAGGEERTLRIRATVHSPVIPPVGRESFPYTNWFSVDNMAARHGLETWSEAHWGMIGRYAALMAHARQNTFLCPLKTVFTVRKNSAPVLDRRRLRRLVETMTDAGMHFIEGGHFARRTGGEWRSPTFDVALGGSRATSAEGNAAIAGLAHQLTEEMDRNGWRDRWIQHIADEPTDANAADYRILAGILRKYMPGVPILDATMNESLVGAVDIWCPQVQEYQRHRDFFESQRALGDRVWFYTCCCPGGPWLNRLLDMELLRPALFGWGAAMFDLDGFLHWGLNQYKADQNPFEKSVVGHGGSSFLPAGDTHIVYPGEDGPWSSVRLEAQREGIEDYELLRLLKARDHRAADRVVRKAITGFDSYTTEPKVLRAARREVLTLLGEDAGGGA